jgi:hypothetical protein
MKAPREPGRSRVRLLPVIPTATDQLLTVVPLLFDDTETEPLFVCETLTEFELVAEAFPLDTVALEVPVFDPEFVFDADPPVFPVVLPLESPLPPMSPPLAEASAPWWLRFDPETCESAEL